MAKSISAELVRKTIAYFYLIAYCPPERIADFKRMSAPMRMRLAAQAGMQEAAYFNEVIPLVFRRILAYQQDSREPDQELVDELIRTACNADDSPEAAAEFQAAMIKVSALPGRAKLENRLHLNGGCALCKAACQYGYFSLISDPDFPILQKMFAAETNRTAIEQSALLQLYGFTLNHLAGLAGADEGFIKIEHLTGLSYCLLLLAMAKSRQKTPEAQLRILQAGNQEFIRRHPHADFIHRMPAKR